MEEMIGLIKDLGFPVVIALWLLLRVDGILCRMLKSLQDLVGSADELSKNHESIHARLNSLDERMCIVEPRHVDRRRSED